MLDASQLDVDGMQLTFVKTQLDTVLRLAVEPLIQAMRERRIQLEIEGMDELPPIYADFKRLVQSFTNLLGNAVKFTERGAVELSVESLVEDRYRFEVVDTGIGIAAADLAAFFEPYNGYLHLLPRLIAWFASHAADVAWWPAIYNGYPLLYWDSAGYIHDWSHHIRPVGYNVFIWITSVRVSLWFTVFAQALITSYLMMRTAGMILGQNSPASILAAFSILLSVILLTSISKYTSWLMPDIFTSWVFFGFLLFCNPIF